MQPLSNLIRIHSTAIPIKLRMSPLSLLVDLFVNTFGITPPTPQTEARAGRVIAIMLICVLAVIVAAAWLLRSILTH
jgi:hypothetical protein